MILSPFESFSRRGEIGLTFVVQKLLSVLEFSLFFNFPLKLKLFNLLLVLLNCSFLRESWLL